ncbi:E3 ubiquitin-protein ligase UBR3 isoform X4 [Hydra vulgaris]|uniref:E3 ubiquitin-protein ligase n=1 Tax=Hydra vulgaris TaxID=6087 RepID=A0ABM4CTC5_HYDVU
MEEIWSNDIAEVIKEGVNTNTGKRILKRVLKAILNPNNIFDETSAKWLKILIAGGLSPRDYFKKLHDYDSALVCGLIWNANFFAYRCRDCGISPCMSLCADCFLAGNHEGHDFNIFKSQAGGACDCGDETVLKKEGFCPNHGKKSSLRSIPDELVALANIVIPKMVKCLYKKVKSQCINDANEGVLNSSTYLLKTLREFSKIEALRIIVSRQMMAIKKCDVLPNKQCGISDFTKFENNRQVVKMSTDIKIPSSSIDTGDLLCKQTFDYQHGFRHSWLGVEDYKETYLQFFMEWLVKLSFPIKLSTFLLQLLPIPDYKTFFTQLFCRQYTAIGKMLTTSLNPDQLSSRIVHVSVQLFSNESLAYKMVKEENLLTIIIFVLDKMIGQCLDYLPVEFEGVTRSILLVDCGNKILKEHCYWPIASDLTNILSHLSIAKVFLESNDCLSKWFYFVKMLVGMNINKRRFLVYAEFESKMYYSAFSIEFECVASVMWELYRAINKLSNIAYVKCMIEASVYSLDSCSLVNKLKKTSFTFHLTVHRHFALFLHQAIREYNDTSVMSSIDHIKTITMSYLINLLVSIEEIRAGLWRFNGHQITCQTQSYMQSCFCNSMLDLDIFLLQVLITRCNVDDFIEMLVDRLSLRQWLHFTEKNENGENTDENCLVLVQGFLNIIHILLSHRVYSGLSEDELLRKDMIANLCVADRTHSQLAEIVALRPANTHCSYKNFDQLLSEVADFKPPAADMSGLQQGLYVPKDEIWEQEYDYMHIYLRIFKKSNQQNSLERYNKVMSKRYNSSASCYWPPSKSFPKLHSAYEGLFKLFRSKKLQQILIFISYQIQHGINTMPEMLLISTVHLLQLFAENRYEIEDCVSLLDDDDQMIDLIIEYVDCYPDKQKLFFVSEKLKEKVLESNRKSVWEEEMFKNIHEDLIFDMFLIYKSELILPLTDYLETLIKKTPQASTLLHLRTLLSQLSYKKFILLKRFIQYFYYYCKTNDIEITKLPFMVKEDSVTTQAITLLFDHFNFLFQVGKPIKNFPVESYDIKLPHTFLSDNAHVVFNNTLINDSNIKDIDYIRKNYDLWILKQRSVDQFEPTTNGFDDQPMDIEPMDISNDSEKICATNNLSLLTILVKLHRVLSEQSKLINTCDIAGDGIFYVGKLLKTFYNQSKFNEFLKVIYPKVFTFNDDTIGTKNQVENAKLERRKKVNQRQEEMLKEFAFKQKRFLDNTIGSSSNDSGSQHFNNHDIYECVICFQSTESTEKRPIGLVVFLQPSTVLAYRVSQTSEYNEMCEFRETCGNLVQQRETELLKISGSFQLALEIGSDVGVNVQTCGHFVHIDCHQAYFQTLQDDNQLINITKGEFLCPLCRGFSNEVLPILPDCIKEVHNTCMESEGAIKSFKEKVAEIKNLMETPKFSSLRKRSFDISVLTASTSLFYNSLEELTKLHMVEKQFHVNKFTVLIALLRHNLEETMMNTSSFKDLSEQRKKCLLALFEFGNFNAQSLSTPTFSYWIRLTCGVMKKSEVGYLDIPFLLMDPVSLLIQFVTAWPYRINAEELYCIIQSLYNLVYVQALLSIGLKVKESEKESWYRNAKRSEKITLSTLVNLVWRCSSMLYVNETANSSEGLNNSEITLSVMSPHSVEYHIEQLCLPFLKKAYFFMSIWLLQNEIDVVNSFVSYASLLKLGGCSVNYAEEELSTVILKWSPDESAISVISSWCEELIEYLMKKKINYKKILPIANEWKMPSLIKLPLLFDSLFQEYRKQKCARCKKIPEDPTLCLVCGKFLCFRSSCCIYKETVYECVQHSSDCGYGTGLFLVISSSLTLIIRDERICPWGSVYLDSFGEEDKDLKRGKPLFLNKERYAKLESEWRMHTLDKSNKHWRLHLNRL